MSKQGHCKDYLNRFSEYIDGDLSPELCQQLEAHMAGCRECRVVMNTMQRTIELYHGTGGETALPEDVRARLFSRLKLDDYKKWGGHGQHEND